MKKIIDKYSTFFKYIFSAGVSYAIDLSLFTILNYCLKDTFGLTSILIATIISRIISSFINYLLNRNIVFKNNTNKFDIKTFSGYVILVIIQMLVSSISVMFIYKNTYINETIIKLFVDVILFIVNYYVQKNIIFKNKPNKI